FLPYFYKKNTIINDVNYYATTIPSAASSYYMVDKNLNTYTEFVLDKDDKGTVTITLRSSSPITSSAIMVLLDKNIALPTSVELSALVDYQFKKLLAKSSMPQQTIRFPETTSSQWEMSFTYAQPLRINEIRLVQESPDKSSNQSLRFLAQPGRSYRVYFDSDRASATTTSEAGNLYSDEGVLILNVLPSLKNPLYIQSDLDNDALPDVHDNCVSVYNQDQEDLDGNGRGDACDDFDRDGVINDEDNCKNDPNINQRDTDRDKIGDVCDVEESRITEKYKWIPWLGIIFALVVIGSLFIITARSKDKAL
ncbi:MAG: thrombospondin type 3 repeat-containing protein, partial [bacterium]|nr:thrombospondin type 3 repeat-containing protein [bacterium]